MSHTNLSAAEIALLDRQLPDIGGAIRGKPVTQTTPLSLALQHGTPIETIRRAVTRGASEAPASILGAIVDALLAAAGACQ